MVFVKSTRYQANSLLQKFSETFMQINTAVGVIYLLMSRDWVS